MTHPAEKGREVEEEKKVTPTTTEQVAAPQVVQPTVIEQPKVHVSEKVRDLPPVASPVQTPAATETPVSTPVNAQPATTVGTDVQQAAAEQPVYRHKWDQASKDGKSYREVVNDKNYNTNPDSESNAVESLLDYNRWADANGKPRLNIVEWYASMHPEDDISKSPAENKKERERQKRKEAFDHIGNVLANLGNFVGTVGFGGLNIPQEETPVQYTERQRKLREATRAQRQAYNKDFFANYWKDRAEERQRERDQALIQYRNIQGQAAQQKADDNTRKTDATVAYYNAKTGQLEMITPAQLEKYQAEAEAARKRGNAAATNAAANMTRAQKAEDKSRGTVVTVTKDGRNKTTRESRPAGSPSKSTTTKKKVVY